MRNLCYFCHYHRGDTKEQAFKIAGSFLIAAALFTWGFSASTAVALDGYLEIASEMLPEAAPQPALPPPLPSPSPSPAPSALTPPVPESEGGAERAEHEARREAEELANTTRWKNDRLREWRDQLREIVKVRRQIVRLKGAQEETAKLDAMKERLTQCQSQLIAATDHEAMKDVLEGVDCNETGELWEEINQIRQAIEIPKELNRWLLAIKKLERIAVQKWAKKIVDLTPVVGEIKARYDEAKAAYQAGEFEDTWELIREHLHERGDPRECEGALHMLRGFIEPLRRIKDKALKAELEGLTEPVKAALTQGECREAREAAEAIQRELGPQIFKLIFDSQQRKRALPTDLLERIERVRQKLEQQEASATAAPAAEVAPVQ